MTTGATGGVRGVGRNGERAGTGGDDGGSGGGGSIAKRRDRAPVGDSCVIVRVGNGGDNGVAPA